MRVLVESEIVLHDLEQMDFDFFRHCSIFHHKHKHEDGLTTLLVQKIDLEPEDMENFLTILDFSVEGLIPLDRYCHGRYVLRIRE